MLRVPISSSAILCPILSLPCVAQDVVPFIRLSADETAKAKQLVQTLKDAKERGTKAKVAWKQFRHSYQTTHSDLPGLKFTDDFRLAIAQVDSSTPGVWYQQHLGISLTPSSYEDSVWQQEAGPTVFDPQPETSDLFRGTDKVWMLNFRVRDLDKMAAQLRAAGIAVEIDPQSYPNGRFASLHDPERNPIQFWQPAKPAAPR
jgi:glyoxylase I family protein